MTVYTGPVFDWDRSGLDWDKPPYESSSPNLLALEAELRARFGGGNMGIHHDKKTSNGKVSEHSWGAALDHGTDQSMVDWMRGRGIPTGKVLTRAEHFAMVDWVVAHSAELHIQSIVDIGRSWRADRVDNGAGGWKIYNSTYTGHAHFVTTFDGWGDATPIADRLEKDTDMQPVEIFTFVKLGTPGPAYERTGNLVRYLSPEAWAGLGSPSPTVRRTRTECRAFHLLNECPREDRGIWANA